MKKILFAALAVAAVSAPSALALPPVAGVHEKVTICHNTGSAKNPIVIITVDLAGKLNGHTGEPGKHQESGDAVLSEGKCDDGKGSDNGGTGE